MSLQKRDGATEEHAEHLCTSGVFAANTSSVSGTRCPRPVDGGCEAAMTADGRGEKQWLERPVNVFHCHINVM